MCRHGRWRLKDSTQLVPGTLKHTLIRQAYGREHTVRDRVDSDRPSLDERRRPSAGIENGVIPVPVNDRVSAFVAMRKPAGSPEPGTSRLVLDARHAGIEASM